MTAKTNAKRLSVGESLTLCRKVGLTPGIWFNVIALQALSTVLEGVGIGMFVPVFYYLRAGGQTPAGANWQRLLDVYAFLRVEVTLLSLLIVMFAAFVLRQVVLYARQAYMIRKREVLAHQLRHRLFDRYLHATSAYHDAVPVGATLNALTTELRFAVDSAFGPPQIACYAIVVPILIVVLMLTAGPVTALALAIMGGVGFCLIGLFRRSVDSGTRLREDNRSLSTFLTQRISSPRVIRLSGVEEAEVREFDTLSMRQRDSSISVRELVVRGDLMYEPLAVAALLTMVYVGHTILGVTVAEFAVLFVVAIRLLPTIKEIFRQYQGTMSQMPHLASLSRRLDELDAAQEGKGGTRAFGALNREVRFNDVVFRYPTGESPALAGISLEIPAGQMVGLIGPSGAGKSTLVDMLLGLRMADSGVLSFDGVPIGEFELASLRAHIAYAPQSPQIFDVTVRQHIAYGKPGATDAEIERAARLAGAEAFIRGLPEGYETYVGEDGVRLSGGQRHRLDLARALVRGAPILVLDEPTSALDADAEENFRNAIAGLRAAGGMTIVVIAHRLSTVAGADRIIVLRDGQVEDWGTHEQLIQRGGWYAQAHAKQHQANPPPRIAAGGA